MKNWLLKIPILDYRSLVTDGERKSKYFFSFIHGSESKSAREKKKSCNNVSNYVTSIYGDLFTY